MRHRPGKTSIIIDHVANVHRFGLPDDKRVWDLVGKKKKKQDFVLEFPIKECNECYAAYPASSDECPECGHVNETDAEKNGEKEVIEAELEEIKKGDIEIKLDFREPQDCESFEELRELGKNRSYKPGWAYHQAKLRGWV